MIRNNESRTRIARRRAIRTSWTALLAVAAFAALATEAVATPLSFSLINVSSSNQSRLDLKASLKLSGTPVDDINVKAQVAPIPLVTLGSLTTLYNDLPTNDSKVLANVTQQSITFGGGSTAIAQNGTSTILGPLQIAPGVGAVSGTAPANYGIVATAPVIPPIVLPAFDLSLIGLSGTLNLGQIISIDAQIALRDMVVDVTGPAGLPLAPAGTPPPTQSFDASQLQIGITGTSDIALGVRVQQASILDWGATGLLLTGLQGALSGAGIPLTITPQISTLSYLLGFGISAPLPTTFVANDDATPGTLERVGSNYRLTIPVKFDVVPETLPAPLDQFFTAELGFSGKLIGQTPFQILEVPEPSSVILAALAVVGLVPVGLRARNRRAA